MHATSSVREPLITGGKTVGNVSEDISRQVEGKPTQLWWMAFGVSFVFLLYDSIVSVSFYGTEWEYGDLIKQ